MPAAWPMAAAGWALVNLIALSAIFPARTFDWQRYLAYAAKHLWPEFGVSAAVLASSMAVVWLMPQLARAKWRYTAALAVTMLDLGYQSAGSVALTADAQRETPSSVAGDPSARVVEAPRDSKIAERSLNYSKIVPMIVRARLSSVVTNEGGVLPSALQRLHRAIETNPGNTLAVSACNWAYSSGDDSWRRLPGALPRLRLLPERCRELISTPLERLASADVDALRAAVIGEIETIHEDPQSLELTVTAPERCRLVLADLIYPGWECSVDGHSIPIEAAHEVFRAITVESGKHHLNFRFRSAAFHMGVYGSVAGAMLVLGMFAFGQHIEAPTINDDGAYAAFNPMALRPSTFGAPRWAAYLFGRLSAAGVFPKFAMLGIALLLTAPLASSGPAAGTNRFVVGLPRVNSGDEPHYLLMLNSLLRDGDLDLTNNYRDVHSGSHDAGRRFAGELIDHQVNWYSGGELRSWAFVFDTERSRWKRDEQGRWQAPLKPGVACSAPDREYCWHPPGLAIALASLLFPLKSTTLIEPAALTCSALAVALAALAFYVLVQPLASRPNYAVFATAMAFLGTPAWHYGRTLFTEPFLTACVTAAYALFLRRRRNLLAGSLLAAGTLMKPPFAVLALPLLVDRLAARDARSICAIAIPIAGATAVLCAFNQHMYGAPWRGSMHWMWSNPVAGLAGLAFSWEHGLLPLSPVAIVALVQWPSFYRTHRRDAALVGSACGIWIALVACWGMWHGGHCYGPRLIVPIVPLLLVPLATLPAQAWWQLQPPRRMAIALCGVSVMLNAVAAFACDSCFGVHPLAILKTLLP